MNANENLRLKALAVAGVRLLNAVYAQGCMPEGYCFCSWNRDGAKEDHAPECAELRAAITQFEAAQDVSPSWSQIVEEAIACAAGDGMDLYSLGCIAQAGYLDAAKAALSPSSDAAPGSTP